MLRASLVACLAASLSLGLGTGCGPKVPTHTGYKTKAPWKKAKPLTLDEKMSATSKGELDYADYKRAKWLTLEVPDGNLTVNLEFTPTDAAEDATVAMEILDSSFNVISQDEDAPLVPAEDEEDERAKDDEEDEEEDEEEEEEEDEEEEEEEDDDSGGNTQKTRVLPNLTAGTYYVHLFLTKRLDTAEYKLAVQFEAVSKEPESSFPKDVAWVPALPIVPFDDDAPAPAPPPKDKKPPKKGHKDKPDRPDPPDEEPASTGAVTARIIDVKTAGNGTGADIQIGAGTDQGLAAGRKGSISGVKKGGSFTLASCTARTCKASVSASVDDVNRSSKSVTIK